MRYWNNAMKNIVFYLGMGTFFTHELDAIQRHEWRILPLTNWLPDEYGFIVFLFSHIPLFAILIALIASTREKIRMRSRIGISIALIIHGFLHAFFMGNATYEFMTLSSTILIFGGALLGIAYLLLEYSRKTTA
jgi:hypothetical protein